MYEHFLKLSCACRILSCEVKCIENAELANTWLVNFVKSFATYYGELNLSYNVHNLLHLSGCVKQFGYLQSFSCYKFVNYMQKKVKKPSQILHQIFHRIQEEWAIQDTESSENG